MKEPRTEQIGCRTTAEIKELIDREAQAREWTPSYVIHVALRDRYGLDGDGAEGAPPLSADDPRPEP